MKEVNRRYEVTVLISADDKVGLFTVCQKLADNFGAEHDAVAEHKESYNYSYVLQEFPEQTPEKYQAELEKLYNGEDETDDGNRK